MGYKGPLKLVTPHEFRARTSLALSARSGTTLAMDKAYDAYYAHRSSENADALYEALKAYRAAHGRYWNECERDVVSGGLLSYLFEEVNPNKLSAAKAAELDRRAADRIRNIEIPSARLGVLYFLANIKVELDPFTSVVESVSAAAGVLGVGLTTDISKTASAADGTRAVFTAPVMGTAVKAEQLALAGKVAMHAGKALVNVGQSPSAPTQPPSPLQPRSQYLPTTSAALFALSSSLSSNLDAGRYLRMAGTAALAAPVTLGALAVDAVRQLWDKVWGALSQVGQAIQRAWYRKGDLEAARYLGMLVKAAVRVAADLVMKNAVPFLGGAVDVATGLARSIGDACSRVRSWLDRRHLDLQAGHPAQIANAIESQMSKGVFRGLAEALVGAAKAAISVFLPGLGSLVSVVIGAVDWMVRIVSRLLEQSAIQRFLEDARRLYVLEKKQVKQVDGVYAGSKDSHRLINNSARFGAFFQRGCEASPLIPMLTLNSGLAGNWMTLLNLFTDDASPRMKANAGEQVLKADDYFGRLKRHGVDYMRQSGFRFMPLMSHDTLMQGYLKHATGGGQMQGGSLLGSVEALARA